ncbi:ATP-binding cassette domain-containing protein [Promethearchaeum syntrophicum]|uniref:ATP-binding cassette domain-containing protein n=1 Tax=Promethearchaeum syntrophicum TaxID=2594042 RepID=A0A5B9DB06_9ARCH|nr:ABC transporter ATP-binding protein [Candidatus Prometheoarchaeum syntrophicum]QEE16429.1 Molybdate/tungstate import ATP-binding protein WtpC [Candidatus Prometheoarchaeum syntrophicum]
MNNSIENTIILKNVTKIFAHPSEKFTNISIFNGLDLEIDSSKLNFIIGPSGSGKTTFLKMILGIESVSAGTIIFNEFEIHKINYEKYETKAKYWKQVGYINQFPQRNICFSLSVEDNLKYSYLSNSSQKKKKNEINEILSEFNLLNQIHTKTEFLSGGEIQRLSFACAMVNPPKLMLCDEPTSQLDEENKYALIDLLHKIQKKYNICVIISTHDLSIAKNSNILKISGGKIEYVNC